MRVAVLLAALSVLPVPAFAQGNQSFVQGFGGLRLASAPELTPTAGATLGVGLTQHIQVIGEVGHIHDVMPSTIETLLSVSPVSVRRSALYGEGGVRLTSGPVGHVGVYGETLYGVARLNTAVSGDGCHHQPCLAIRQHDQSGRLARYGRDPAGWSCNRDDRISLHALVLR